MISVNVFLFSIIVFETTNAKSLNQYSMFGSKQLSMKKNALLQKSYKFVKGGFPLLGWLPQYNAEKAVSDLVAGISIGLTLIPQVIAYSALAGLTPQVSE